LKRELGLCLLASHITLIVYWLITATTHAVLYLMTFVTGVVTILIFSSSELISDVRNFVAIGIVGVTTFLTSTVISIWVPIFSAVFKWTISVAFTMGSLNSMRLIDAKTIVVRNVIYHTLTLILNIAYAIMTKTL